MLFLAGGVAFAPKVAGVLFGSPWARQRPHRIGVGTGLIPTFCHTTRRQPLISRSRMVYLLAIVGRIPHHEKRSLHGEKQDDRTHCAGAIWRNMSELTPSHLYAMKMSGNHAAAPDVPQHRPREESEAPSAVKYAEMFHAIAACMDANDGEVVGAGCSTQESKCASTG